MTPQQIIDAWNAQADAYNQWYELSEDEKLTWAFKCASAKPEQKPMGWITYESTRRLLRGGNIKGAVPIHAKKSATAEIPVYITPPQQERNFCPRCGKRLGKNDWDVHTCTPPRGKE